MEYGDKNVPLTQEVLPSFVNRDNPEGFFPALAVLFVVTVAIVVLLLNQTPQP
jgi:hypothetical protein